MYPTKSTYEYMNEMDRLFPRNNENDFHHTPNTSNNTTLSPLHQSTSFNRSSSSADSASSGSYPDMSHRDRLQLINQSLDTPFTQRRQRPIVGRKIFDNPKLTPTLEQMPKPFEEEITNSIWHSEDQSLFPNTPPAIEHKKYTANVFYELFPAEQKGFQFRSPVSPRSSPSNYSSQTLFGSQFSPRLSNISPNTARTILPNISTHPAFQHQLNIATTSRSDIRSTMMCTFCRKNGERPVVYMSHIVKEKVGNQNVVTCPILRSHVCSECGATGDNAHTITYCPVLRSRNNGLPLQSTTITLKNTPVKSNGKRRY